MCQHANPRACGNQEDEGLIRLLGRLHQHGRGTGPEETKQLSLLDQDQGNGPQQKRK